MLGLYTVPYGRWLGSRHAQWLPHPPINAQNAPAVAQALAVVA